MSGSPLAASDARASALAASNAAGSELATAEADLANVMTEAERSASLHVCRRVEAWLEDQKQCVAFFYDKEGLNDELQAAMAAADRKERKQLTKAFDARRAALETQAKENAEQNLPALFGSFFSLHAELRVSLSLVEAGCRRERAAVEALPESDRGRRCRIFYDGTSDDTYSNFKGCRFAVGPLGFLKGEQFFHVVKALLCGDLAMAVRMMLTTGGPALRRMGREVEGYAERGGAWEDIDSGLLLLTCAVIKLAAVQPEARAASDMNARLYSELLVDGRQSPPLHIVEGAKDDERCGIGMHAESAGVLRDVAGWGRNQLGHACMVCCRYVAACARDAREVASVVDKVVLVEEDTKEAPAPRQHDGVQGGVSPL